MTAPTEGGDGIDRAGRQRLTESTGLRRRIGHLAGVAANQVGLVHLAIDEGGPLRPPPASGPHHSGPGFSGPGPEKPGNGGTRLSFERRVRRAEGVRPGRAG
ncbi:hypothetical protein [Nonomuraea ceibae]|uniref:hypothetical protein n=1 Tax=Nonomuraea ceibae TaxID=1935170 RepID=UPI001C5EA158|nr:hypothetical protein [Nonomuraea ceibae]